MAKSIKPQILEQIKLLLRDYFYNKSLTKWLRYNDWWQYKAQDPMELYEYATLESSQTNLPIRCYVDESGSYKRHHHPLWLYVANGYNHTPSVVPFSICGQQQPLFRNPKSDKIRLSKEDVENVKQFIKLNLPSLIDLGEEKIDFDAFCKQLVPIEPEKDNLLEYRVLKPQQTNLPVNIWIDDGKTWEKSGHAPRIKIPYNASGTNTRTWSSVRIAPTPQLMHDTLLPSKVVRQILNFVQNNQQELLQVSNQEIDINQFLKLLQNKNNASQVENTDNRQQDGI